MDPEQLTLLLRRAGITDTPRAVTHLGRFSTDVWRVDCGRQAMLVKHPYRAHRVGEPWQLEHDVYRTLAVDMPVRVPRLIGSIDDTLIIEYVDNLLPFDFGVGPTVEHGDAAIGALARLHAHYMNRDLPRFVPDLSDAARRRQFAAEFDDSWRNNRDFFDEVCPGFSSIGDALVDGLADTLLQLARPATLLHGDPHAENLPLCGDGEIAFLDWQTARVGNPGFDVAVFTAMSYPTNVRRRVEERLVQRYVDRLSASGATLPDPWDAYRLGILRRAARIVEIVKHGFPSARWVFGRCAQAAVDLKVGELIVGS